MTRSLLAAVAAVAVAACIAGPVGAEPWHNPDRPGPGGPGPGPGGPGPGPGRPGPGGPGWHGGPPRHGPPPGPIHREFRRPPPRADWQRGRWYHGDYGGRAGWWWIVNGTWFYYAQPVYPYPAYVYTPPPAPPGPATYYYCYNPPGYYPNVPACPSGWYATPAP